jgi:putative transposase
MSSTHLCLYYHFVFSTKCRRTWIHPSWQGRLHSYLGGMLRSLGGVTEAVGGVSDHAHILASLKATHCVADVMRDIKSCSSEWIHDVTGNRLFGWQDGYGAFTVCRSEVGTVRQYINAQEEHHRKVTFQEEYLKLLQQSGIDFDERYLW